SLGKRTRYAFDPRGGLFAQLTDSDVSVRNLTTGKIWRKIPLEKDNRDRVQRVDNLFFGPDGQTLAVSRNGNFRKKVVDVWDLKLNKVVGRVETERYQYDRAFGFAVHGRYLLGGRFTDEEWQVWDLWDRNGLTLKLPPNNPRSGYKPKHTPKYTV